MVIQGFSWLVAVVVYLLLGVTVCVDWRGYLVWLGFRFCEFGDSGFGCVCAVGGWFLVWFHSCLLVVWLMLF